MDDSVIDKHSLIQIIECGYRYVCPIPITKEEVGTNSSSLATLSKWMCDRKGCEAWIIEHIFPNDYSFIEVRGQHNHPPYPESYKFDVPYPHVPGIRYPYKILKLMCECKRGNIDPDNEEFLKHLDDLFDIHHQGFKGENSMS